VAEINNEVQKYVYAAVMNESNEAHRDEVMEERATTMVCMSGTTFAFNAYETSTLTTSLLLQQSSSSSSQNPPH